MKLVQVDYVDAVALVTLNDPGRRNILSADMVEQFREGLGRIEQADEIRAVVVTGAGSAFCAGADVRDLAAASRGDDDAIRAVYSSFLSLGACGIPTIAAVNGPAIGAGLNLALSCDVRICSRAAYFEARFLDIKLHPGGGNAWMLTHLVNSQLARAMLLFGEKVDGERAERIGFAWRCVDDQELLDNAVALGARAARHSADLSALTKSTLRQAETMEYDAAVVLETERQTWSLGRPETAGALADVVQRLTGN